MGMPDVADDLQRSLFHVRTVRVKPEEFERDADPRPRAGSPGLPDLTEPAPAQQADQSVTSDGRNAGIQGV
jgi:hypothetical protein